MSQSSRFAARVGRVPPTIMIGMAETARKLASTGVKVIDLALGAPEVPPPNHILDAIKKATDDGQTGFYPLQGLHELRQAIADTLKADDGSDVSPQEVVVTCGVKQATFLTVMALIDHGDEVIVPDPCFPPYREVIAVAGGVSIPFAINGIGAVRSKVPDLEKLITRRTKMILLNYPNNPSGWVPSRDDLKGILETASRHDLVVVSDEIYEKSIFDGHRHHHLTSFADMKDRVVMTNGFSKTYSMVAYRLGYMVADKKTVEEAMKLMRCTITMVPYPIQKGGIAALRGPQDFVKERVETYRRRRDRALRRFAEIGLDCRKPDGTFYLFPNISKLGIGSMEFCRRMLEEAQVSMSPGISFGENWDNYFRLSLGVADDKLEQVLDRIGDMVSKLTKR